jgi:hypothetical protein
MGRIMGGPPQGRTAVRTCGFIPPFDDENYGVHDMWHDYEFVQFNFAADECGFDPFRPRNITEGIRWHYSIDDFTE